MAGGEGRLCLRLKSTTNTLLKDEHSVSKDIQRLWNSGCLTLQNSDIGQAQDTKGV